MNVVASVPLNTKQPDWMLTNYDRETTFAPDLDIELKRLTVLRTFPLLRANEADADYEMLAELAMSLLEAPMACVKLADLSSIRVVASAGSWPKHVTEILRRECFCAHTVQSRTDVFVVYDTLDDDRFRSFAQVTGSPSVRFYAGAPLVTAEGAKIGSVCVFDTQPRLQGLSEQQCDHLKEIAKLVVDMMEASRRQATQDAGRKQPRSRSMPLGQSPSSSKHTSSSSQRPHGSTGNLQTFDPSQAVTVSSFIRGLKIAMEAFPKHVEVHFHMHPTCPLELTVANDLAVFRSAVAVLANACERTKSGFVRLTVRAGKAGHVAFVCEDTGPNLDPTADLFDPNYVPLQCVNESAEEQMGCIRIDPVTGKVMSGTVCVPSVHASANGYSLHVVSVYMKQLGGEYGFEPRNATDGTSGSIVWLSLPIDGTSARPRFGVAA
ncbi:hypothetical protein MPSEU_000925700 [Mayamaea pseudoterrestris]|nr:hypothetical protein MPSEU_000925700 [Mayamaea pseudoterrestris]